MLFSLTDTETGVAPEMLWFSRIIVGWKWDELNKEVQKHSQTNKQKTGFAVRIIKERLNKNGGIAQR